MSVCLVTQLCPTLFDPMDCSPRCSSVHGDSPGKSNGVSCHALLQGIFPTQGLNSGLPHCRQTLPSEPPGKPMNTGVGSLSLLQGIFPTQELNLGLLHCKWILYQLSYQGSPYIEFLKFSDKKKNKAIKNEQRIWIDISPKKMYKWPHEQMLNLISYQGNTNQNRNEMPLDTHLNVCNQILFVEINAAEDVEQLETYTLAVGKWNVQLFREAVWHFLKHWITMWSRNFNSGHMSKRNENICPHKNLHMNVHGNIMHSVQQ